MLSEGGYGYVWKAIDLKTQKHFAIKKMICQNEEKLKVAKNEIEIMVHIKNLLF